MEMDVWWTWSVSRIISSRNKFNTMGEGKHLWWTSAVVLKNSPGWLFERTALLEFPYSAWNDWSGPFFVLKLLRTCHKPACQTLFPHFSVQDMRCLYFGPIDMLKMWRCSLAYKPPPPHTHTHTHTPPPNSTPTWPPISYTQSLFIRTKQKKQQLKDKTVLGFKSIVYRASWTLSTWYFAHKRQWYFTFQQQVVCDSEQKFM